MNRKGFSLIELLLVIVIIGIISAIFIPNVIVLINKNDKKSCEELNNNIIAAAKMYVNENRYELDFDCSNPTKTIEVSTLIESGKLSGTAINPVTKEDLSTKKVEVKFNCTTRKYSYKFDNSCEKQ